MSKDHNGRIVEQLPTKDSFSIMQDMFNELGVMFKVFVEKGSNEVILRVFNDEYNKDIKFNRDGVFKDIF